MVGQSVLRVVQDELEWCGAKIAVAGGTMAPLYLTGPVSHCGCGTVGSRCGEGDGWRGCSPGKAHQKWMSLVSNACGDSISTRSCAFAAATRARMAKRKNVSSTSPIRAWRHFSSLRDRKTFCGRGRTLSPAESSPRWGTRHMTRNRSVALPPADLLPAEDTGSASELAAAKYDEGSLLQRCIDDATAKHHLTPIEAAVLEGRLADGDATCACIGERLGIDANRAAVTRCRAVPKLRVFLFTHHREAIKGRCPSRCVRASPS